MEQKQPNIQTREDACRWAVMRVRALIADEADWVTNLANASAAIFECWKEVSWAGFYLMKNGELVLGPFQGKPACRRIAVGKGVCGTTAAEQKTQLVADPAETTAKSPPKALPYRFHPPGSPVVRCCWTERSSV